MRRTSVWRVAVVALVAAVHIWGCDDPHQGSGSDAGWDSLGGGDGRTTNGDITAPLPDAPPNLAGGEALYRELCKYCHGPFGEGDGPVPRLNPWTESREKLVEQIDTEMPEGFPELCTGTCAEQVADYILSWSALDSVDCSEPHYLPPRLRLLNRREYTNTVHDLFGLEEACVPGSGCAGEDCNVHTFTFDAQGATYRTVHVAGTFNAWAPTLAEGGWALSDADGDGIWEGQHRVEDGAHEYRLVLDENVWIQDPANPDAVPNEFGEFNSALNTACGATSGADCHQRTFTYDAGGASPGTVHIAGTFNDWAPSTDSGWALSNQGGGQWSGTFELENGEHQYKIVVDNTQWLQDPNATRTAPDGFGGQNSMVVVSCDDAGSPTQPTSAPPLRAIGLTELTTDFPPEVRPQGYGFDTHADAGEVTAAHVEAYLDTAAVVATQALARVDTWLPCHDDGDAAGCARTFATEVVDRAFRRPLTDAEITRYAGYVTGDADFYKGLNVALQITLMSPHFLYRSELGEPVAGNPLVRSLTAYERATALSYTFWSTMPDAALMEAARTGKLDTPEGLRAEASRLLADPRARAAVRVFALQWLGLERVLTVNKADTRFDNRLRFSMLEETARFVEHVTFDSTGTLDELLTADYTFIDAPLASLYGHAAPSEALERVTQRDGRAGILGHASVLASYSHSDQSSPIKRGLFIREHLLCQTFPPPPADAGGIPEVDPDATTRERFFQHTNNEICAACHQYIDGIGFGFERFGPIGERRDTENGMPIDDTGSINNVEGFAEGDPDTVDPFSSLAELGGVVASSQAAADCFSEQYFRFASGGLVDTPAAHCAVRELKARVASGGAELDILDLMLETTQLPTFTTRRAEETTP